MKENQSSVTAMVTAFSRAYHSIHDREKIFDDFLADKLFSAEEHLFLGKAIAELLKLVNPEKAETNPDLETAIAWVMQHHTASIALSRARYAEDNLKLAVKEGASQYVILGAGFDTFAYREPEMMRTLRVFEVDFPATQEQKRQRIRNAGWKIPSSLKMVSMDFNKDNLADALGDSGYDRGLRTVFSWLGVTYYLPIEAIRETLRAIAGIAPKGSEVIYDYMDKDGFDPEKACRRVKVMRTITERSGEAMMTGFNPDTLAEELNAFGFRLAENLSPVEIEERYFAGRTDDYHAFENVHLARANVK
jgi:methyltransferase (TIGR00027 family)